MLSSGWVTQLFASVIVCLIGAGYTYWVLTPTTGFDDAAITMNFAQNIAEGHGYVYFIGGERVEGSTSAIWTAINVLVYKLFGTIEKPLFGIGFCIAVGIVFVAMLITQLLIEMAELETRYSWITGTAFLLFPPFFGYVIWSAMDIGLFILFVCLTLLTTMRMLNGRATGYDRGLFIFAAGLLGAVRPEGIAVALGFITLLAGFSYMEGRRLGRVVASALGLAISVLVVLTLMREWYFGQPLPNTFYAKVSTSYVSQFIDGIKYVFRYLFEISNFALVLFFLIAPLIVERGILRFWLITLAVLASVFLLYAALGGDHFGSFRFFQVLTPILLPWGALIVVATTAAAPALLTGWRSIFLVAILSLPLVVTWGEFKHTKGGLKGEFEITEGGMQVGTILNEFDPLPSIGILTAGGISLTYEGPIYDLFGLTWVEMAHADRQNKRVKNMSGFSERVLFDNPPDLILPERRACELPPLDFRRVLGDTLHTKAFHDLYTYGCYKGLTFYIKKGLPLPG